MKLKIWLTDKHIQQFIEFDETGLYLSYTQVATHDRGWYVEDFTVSLNAGVFK